MAKKKTTSESTKKVTAKKNAKERTAKKSAAKKSTRKSTAKKATKKKTTAKVSSVAASKAAAKAMQDIIARARDHFRQAPPQNVFFVADGRVLKDLRDLAEALDDMQSHVFSHHVNDDRHDFAAWVHEVLHERALAEEMRQAHQETKPHQHVVYRHIVRRVW